MEEDFLEFRGPPVGKLVAIGGCICEMEEMPTVEFAAPEKLEPAPRSQMFGTPLDHRTGS